MKIMLTLQFICLYIFSEIISPVKDRFSEDLLPPEIHVKVQCYNLTTDTEFSF
jgi:hypothetical protein